VFEKSRLARARQQTPFDDHSLMEACTTSDRSNKASPRQAAGRRQNKAVHCRSDALLRGAAIDGSAATVAAAGINPLDDESGWICVDISFCVSS
jgi:hypothetical protein